MAIMMVLDVAGAGAEQYDQVMKGLAEAGATTPAGRLHHVAGPRPDGWLVVDVWQDEASFAGFAQTLVPLLAQAGLAHARPEIVPVHNVVD
jgi:hypothetical protein